MMNEEESALPSITVESVLNSAAIKLKEIKSPASIVAKNLLGAFRRGKGVGEILAGGGGTDGGITIDRAFGYVLASSSPIPNLHRQLTEVVAVIKAAEEGTPGFDLLALPVAGTLDRDKKPAVPSGFLLGKGGFLDNDTPPNPHPTAEVALAKQRRSQYRFRMVAFYLHYGEPERAAMVDEVLEKYQGKEEDMMAILVRKFGPEPALPPRGLEPLVEASTRADGAEEVAACAEDNDNVGARREGGVGRGEACGEEAVPPEYGNWLKLSASDRARALKNINRANAAGATGPADVDPTIAKNSREPATDERGKEGKDKEVGGSDEGLEAVVEAIRQESEEYDALEVASETAFFSAAVRPPDIASSPAASSSSSAEKGPQEKKGWSEKQHGSGGSGGAIEACEDGSFDLDGHEGNREQGARKQEGYRSRMVAFYLHYGEPERAAMVDEVLEKYQGREAEMMNILVRKYGPEPALPPPPPQPVPSPPPLSVSASVPSFSNGSIEVDSSVDSFANRYQVGTLPGAASLEAGGKNDLDNKPGNRSEAAEVMLATVIKELAVEPFFAPVHLVCVDLLRALQKGGALEDTLESSTGERSSGVDGGNGADSDDGDDTGGGMFEPLVAPGAPPATIEEALDYTVRSTLPKTAKKLLSVIAELR